MIVRLINFIAYCVIAMLVAIQIDEYNVPLIAGHLALAGVVAFCGIMALANLAGAIRAVVNDDLEPIDY